eukprot:snap_masked-scaffold_15-processed-gene-2.37-mRNA-1 protein AED:1.00 eAED:1.00 QI:0/-1/0/0/-1/1/1/0/2104
MSNKQNKLIYEERLTDENSLNTIQIDAIFPSKIPDIGCEILVRPSSIIGDLGYESLADENIVYNIIKASKAGDSSNISESEVSDVIDTLILYEKSKKGRSTVGKEVDINSLNLSLSYAIDICEGKEPTSDLFEINFDEKNITEHEADKDELFSWNTKALAQACAKVNQEAGKKLDLTTLLNTFLETSHVISLSTEDYVILRTVLFDFAVIDESSKIKISRHLVGKNMSSELIFSFMISAISNNDNLFCVEKKGQIFTGNSLLLVEEVLTLLLHFSQPKLQAQVKRIFEQYIHLFSHSPKQYLGNLTSTELSPISLLYATLKVESLGVGQYIREDTCLKLLRIITESEEGIDLLQLIFQNTDLATPFAMDVLLKYLAIQYRVKSELFKLLVVKLVKESAFAEEMLKVSIVEETDFCLHLGFFVLGSTEDLRDEDLMPVSNWINQKLSFKGDLTQYNLDATVSAIALSLQIYYINRNELGEKQHIYSFSRNFTFVVASTLRDILESLPESLHTPRVRETSHKVSLILSKLSERTHTHVGYRVEEKVVPPKILDHDVPGQNRRINQQTEHVFEESVELEHQSQSRIEHRTSELFQNIFSDSRSLEEVLLVLERLKHSHLDADFAVYENFSNNLVDEFQFLEKYPEKALAVIGTVCGSLIDSDLVPKRTLAYILNFLLASLKASMTSKQFKFSLIALSHFKQQLGKPTFRPFAQQVLKMKLLHDHFPGLMNEMSFYLSQGYSVATVPLRGNENPAEYEDLCALLDKAIPVEENLSEEAIRPEDEDEVHFIINNLTTKNVSEYAERMQGPLKNVGVEWIAKYLVLNRIVSQRNYHEVYETFLYKLNNADLVSQVKVQSIAKSRSLLKSQQILDSTSERKALKNIAAWIGRITLAKDEPILLNEIDLKVLIGLGYERGWLSTIVPFVQNLLSGGKDSSVFTSQNPWVKAVLDVLQEVYSLPDLKLIIGIAIEGLFGDFDKELVKEKEREFLNGYEQPAMENNPDYKLPPKPEKSVTQASYTHAPPTRGSTSSTTDEEPIIPNLKLYVKVKQSLEIFSILPNALNLVVLSLDKSIRNCIQAITERSVQVAISTCRKIVLKDFALDPSVEKISRYATLAATNLAGSLAMVTGKDSLRQSMELFLTDLLKRGLAEYGQAIGLEALNQTVTELTEMNLDLGCKLVQKAATDTARKEVLSVFQKDLAQRKEARDKGELFFDHSNFEEGLKYPQNLPPFLLPKPSQTGVGPEFLQVYHDFGGVQRTAVPAPQHNADPHRSLQGKTHSTGEEVMAEWKNIVLQLDKIVQESAENGSLNSLIQKDTAALLQQMRKVGELLQGEEKDQTIKIFSNRIFRRLLEVTSSIARTPMERFRTHVQYAILDTLVNMVESLDLRKFISDWLIFSATQGDDATAVKNSRFSAAGLIKSKLLDIERFDHHLARIIRSSTSPQSLLPLISFAMDILRICVVNYSMAKVGDLRHTIECLEAFEKKQEELRARDPGPGDNIHFPGLKDLLQKLHNIRYEETRDAIRLQSSEIQHQANLENTNTRMEGSLRTEAVAKEHFAMYSFKTHVRQLESENPAGLFVRSREPAELRKKVAKLLYTWMRLYSDKGNIFQVGPHQTAYRDFIQNLHQHGAFESDENTERFLRLCSELVFESALANAKPDPDVEDERTLTLSNMLSHSATDALSKLIVLLIRFSEKSAKPRLIEKILSIVSKIYEREITERKQKGVVETFDQRPYLVFLKYLIKDIDELYPSGNPEFTLLKLELYIKISNLLLSNFSPVNAPVLSVGWISLLLEGPLIDTLTMEAPYLPTSGKTVLLNFSLTWLSFVSRSLKSSRDPAWVSSEDQKDLFLGKLVDETNRFLQHLFLRNPEFLAQYYISLLSALPRSLLKLRNLILCAPGSPNGDRQKILEHCVTLSKLKKGISELFPISKLSAQVSPGDMDNIIAQLNLDTGSNVNFSGLSALIYILLYHCAEIGNTGEKIGLAFSAPFGNLLVLFGCCKENNISLYYFLTAAVDHLRSDVGINNVIELFLMEVLKGNVKNALIGEVIYRTFVERFVVVGLRPKGLVNVFKKVADHRVIRDLRESLIQQEPSLRKLISETQASLEACIA